MPPTRAHFPFLERRIPPPLVVAICAAIMWYLARQSPLLEIPLILHWMTIIGFAATGAITLLVATAAFRRAQTTVNPHKPGAASALVVDGIYRYTRNPMYLGMLFLLLAWAVYLKSPAALMGVTLYWLYMYRYQILPEEQALTARFGDDYEAYMLRVRRWL